MLEGAAQILEHTNCLASGGGWLPLASPEHTPTITVSLPAPPPLQASQAWTKALSKGAEAEADSPLKWGGLGL